MKVVIKETIENNEVTAYSVSTPRNRMGLYNMTECPEDATLNRDLSCIFSLPRIIQEAYDAGKNDEELIFDTILDED